MTGLIEIDDLRRTFSVKRGLFAPAAALQAVAGVSLAVRQGEVLGIVGESGSGKSTLARMILGLLAPTSGSIRLGGRDLRAIPRREIARRMQPVFQDPYSSLNPRRRIADIVQLPLDVQGAGTAGERRARAIAALDKVGLPSRYADSYPSQLSGGQRQRVAIARALVTEPEIVVCDEPTSALDVSVQSQILNLLMDLRRDFGLTYVFISHNLAVIEHIATRVAVMYLGRIVETADRGVLFREPRHPYTRALLDSVLTPEPGVGVPETGLGLSFPNPLAPPPGCAFHPRCPRVMAHCKTMPPKPVSGSGHRLRRMPSVRPQPAKHGRMINTKSKGTRAGAVERARAYVDRGAFEADLTRRVAFKTESQKLPASLPELRRYLDAEMAPAFQLLGFATRIYDNPSAGQGPILLASRIEDSKLPTVLGYGHGDVVRGLEDQWTKGKGPWIAARDGDRLYGRGTADNKGQHTLNMAALAGSAAGARRRPWLQREVHDRDGRGDRLQGSCRAGRCPQDRFRRGCPHCVRRPARAR